MRYRAPRRPANSMITIETEDGDSCAVLKNISTSGAKVSVETPLKAGTQVSVNLFTATRNAKVVWSRGLSAGLAFEHPLEARDLKSLHRFGCSAFMRNGPRSQHGSARGFTEMH